MGFYSAVHLNEYRSAQFPPNSRTLVTLIPICPVANLFRKRGKRKERKVGNILRWFLFRFFSLFYLFYFILFFHFPSVSLFSCSHYFVALLRNLRRMPLSLNIKHFFFWVFQTKHYHGLLWFRAKYSGGSGEVSIKETGGIPASPTSSETRSGSRSRPGSSTLPF